MYKHYMLQHTLDEVFQKNSNQWIVRT